MLRELSRTNQRKNRLQIILPVPYLETFISIPNSASNPDSVQITRLRPTDPVRFKTSVGEINMPEPVRVGNISLPFHYREAIYLSLHMCY